MVSILHRTSQLESRSKLHWLLGLAVEILDIEILKAHLKISVFSCITNKMKPTNPNAHTYVNGTDVKTHGYAVTHNTFLK